MNDDFVRSLRDIWQLQEQDAALTLQRLRQTRWTPHIVLAAEMLGCALALLVGIWFAWVAAHAPQNRLLFGLSAAVMLVTVPALTVASALARRASLAWDDETPQMLLRIGIRRAEASLHAMRLARWHIGIVVAFVTILWVLESLALISAPGFLIFYTAVCLVASLAAWLWMMWRVKRVTRQRDACIRLLAMIEFDDSSEGAPPPHTTTT
jgi:hypothetical protein